MNEHDEELIDRLLVERDDPLGFRAIPGSPLAKARTRAHQAFDPLWQSGRMTRKKAYKWLARQLGMAPSDCHMILFDEEECEEVIRICRLRTLKDTPE